jgi:beta-glucosidase
VRVALTNTGERHGSTVVQVYVGDRDASVSRPRRELKAFRKVALDPGESRVVEMDLPARAFAFWDPAARGWRIEAGDFTIEAGFSAADIVRTATIRLDAAEAD